MFELASAVVEWRGTLRAVSIAPHDIDELESHLQESIDHLRKLGLSDEESFLIATHRLGHPVDLRVEYAKEYSNILWRDRLLWMVVGYFVFSVASKFAAAFIDFGLLGVANTDVFLIFPLLSAVLVICLGYFAMIAVILWLWRQARRGRNFGTVPWILAGLVVVFSPIFVSLLWQPRSDHLLSQEAYIAALLAKGYGYLCFTLLMHVLAAFLMVRLRRTVR